MRPTLYVLLAALFLVRFDLWFWHDARIVLGLPVGLLYQVSYCLAVVLVLAVVVRYAWPDDTTGEVDGEPR